MVECGVDDRGGTSDESPSTAEQLRPMDFWGIVLPTSRFEASAFNFRDLVHDAHGARRGRVMPVGFNNTTAVTFTWDGLIRSEVPPRCGGRCGMMNGRVPSPGVPPVLSDSVLTGAVGPQ
jgi:hypothetical protein